MAFEGQILALDLAGQMGWAFGAPGETPRSGSVSLGRDGASRARQYHAFREWLSSWRSVEPDTRLVIYESPLTPDMVHGHTNIDTLRFLIGLAEHAEEALYGTGVDLREAKVSQVRAYFIDTNRIKRAAAKVATKMRCKQLGWTYSDDNAADALALFAEGFKNFAGKLTVQQPSRA